MLPLLREDQNLLCKLLKIQMLLPTLQTRKKTCSPKERHKMKSTKKNSSQPMLTLFFSLLFVLVSWSSGREKVLITLMVIQDLVR